MNARHRGLSLLLVLGAWQSAPAQTPAPATVPAPAPAQSSEPTTRIHDPYMPAYSSRYRPPSRTAPTRDDSNPDADYGFRNPGGVGRMNEYYPPGNTFDRGSATGARPAATFDSGPSATSRSSQMAAQQLGNTRNRTLHQHIDAYGAPMRFGYGYGFGGAGAFFPY